jgi:hypothetical protein
VGCDNIAKCDSLVVCLILKEEAFVEIGRSEVVCKASNPRYIESFVIAYDIDETVNLRFEVLSEII